MSLGAIFDGSAFSSKGSLFCEVLHSETIRRKCVSNLKDLAFCRGRFVAFGEKKKMCPFLEDVSQKGDAGAAALYGGKGKLTILPSLHGKLTNRGGYL